jgi:hypothetical protein
MRVFKSECATSDELHGRYVCVAETIVDKGDYWEFEVLAPGVSSAPHEVFPVNNCLPESKITEQEHLFERPQFESVGPNPDCEGWQPGKATDLNNPGVKSVVEPVPDELIDERRHNNDLEKLLERMKPYR